MIFPQTTDLIKQLNDNQGVVSVLIFSATLGLGFATGIFKSLRRVPDFQINLIPGPTFACTFDTSGKFGDFQIHRTAIALYLNIANIGSSASSIHCVSVAYHWKLRPFSKQWLRFRLGWFWLHDQVVVLEDFRVAIGESWKVYPFLTQRSSLLPGSTETYLEVGRSTNGIVYFEQPDSWGGCFPLSKNDRVQIKVVIRDVFKRKYKRKFYIPYVSLEEARKFNPTFGKTRAELAQQPLPFDAPSTST